MMRRVVPLLGLAAPLVCTRPLHGQVDDTSAVRVDGPTAVACVDSRIDRQIAKSPDTGAALDDFQWYWMSVDTTLKTMHVATAARVTRTLRLALPEGVREIPCPGFAYVFAVPGSLPKVVREVMTDSDLLDVAARYFGRADLRPREDGADAGHP